MTTARDDRTRTRPAVGAETNHAVDLGSFAIRATDRFAVFEPVDEHLDRLVDQRGARRGGERLLNLRELAQALVDERRFRSARQRFRGRSLFAREREEAGPVEARGREEGEQLVVVALGLAGEADDERRPERGGGLVGADAGR